MSILEKVSIHIIIKMKLLNIFILLFFITGCYPSERNIDTGSYIQTCLMCGSTYEVLPLNRNFEIEETIEWCIQDAQVCDIGMDLYLQCLKDKSDPEIIKIRERELYLHCTECVSCKCSFYSPKQWNSIHKEK